MQRQELLSSQPDELLAHIVHPEDSDRGREAWKAQIDNFVLKD